MENKRVTRRRTKKADVSATATMTTKTTIGNVSGKRSVVAGSGALPTINEAGIPLKRLSPALTRSSPSRRASPGRPRPASKPPSTVPAANIAEPAITQSSSITKGEEDSQNSVSQTNLPATLTTNTASLAPNKIASTSSVHSSYSSTTQQTVEIHTSSAQSAMEINQLADYIRRSASKTFSTNRGGTETREGSVLTMNESRYSRSASRSIYEGDDCFSRAEYSDSDGGDIDGNYEDGDEFKSFNASGFQYSALCRQVKVPREFGGWFGASVLLLLGPMVFYYLEWCCQSSECFLKIPDIVTSFDIANIMAELFYGPAMGAYVAFNFGVFVFSALLPGRYVRLPGSVYYKFAALPMAILILIAFVTAEYCKYPVAEFILKHHKRFAIYGIFNAYTVALWAYLRSYMLNHKDFVQFNNYAKSGNFLINYALGRQLNPKWLDLVEYKQVFYRTSLISTLLYAISLLYESISMPRLPSDEINWNLIASIVQNLKYDSVSSLCSGMVLIYILDSIIFEHHMASSFELHGEGFGCLLLLRYAITPYLLMAVPEYFFVRRTSYTCCFAVWTPFLLLCIGVFLKRFSNAMKYKYRLQPNHPLFTNVDSIHTYQGKRLLVHSVWGFVRQPNYLGDIIALISLTLPLSLRFAWPPLISVSLLIALLIHRCKRVNARNTARYHSSWVLYCRNVPYYLLPHVF
uniref:Steroid 5-alpha reductase C-terminal domain-containing protein n=1 Tax=Glossina brevipalpis TaxID=37001 RepID=A0A1A9WDU7_9MUSC